MAERILYLDLVGGAAGDMLLAALLDAGADFEAVRRAIDALGLDGVELVRADVHPAGLRALQLDVMVRGRLADSETPEGAPMAVVDHPHPHPHYPTSGGHHRPWTTIRDLLDRAELAEPVRRRAQETFRRLAEAEGEAHGLPAEEVVFHEVGADDALVDIVGTAAAVHALGVDRVVASPFPLGRGLGRGAHGPFPVPAPATLALLRGAPTEETALAGETVTPTGAALVQTFADAYGPLPGLAALEAIGVGAGHKRWPDRPNVVRALLGRGSGALPARAPDAVVVSANLDDMSPEHLEPLGDRLRAAGALDVWATPAVFKKGRAGVVVSALGPAAEEPALAQVFFRDSPTLGVRIQPVERRRIPRRIEVVTTRFGPLRVKVAERPDGTFAVKPEHDDVRRAADAARATLRSVEESCLEAWRSRERGEGG